MLIAITLLPGLLVAGFLLVRLGSARARNEERVYLRYAGREGQVTYEGRADDEILSTDDQYLHPNRARSNPDRLRSESQG